MRSTFVSAAAIALCTVASPAAPAFAQDMTMPFNGLYAGINGGYDFGKDNVTTTAQTPVNVSTITDGARRPIVKMDPEGFLGGVQIGDNWQRDSYVFGLETDGQYADMRDTRNFTTTGNAFPGVRNNQFRENMNWFGTTRARLGYAWGNSMIYGTGGIAYGRLKYAVNFSGPLPAAMPQYATSDNRTNFGYTAGGGFEQFLGTNWSIKAEYLYYDLGRSQLFPGVIAGSGGVGTGYMTSFNNKGQIGRIGINYHVD